MSAARDAWAADRVRFEHPLVYVPTRLTAPILEETTSRLAQQRLGVPVTVRLVGQVLPAA